MTDKHWSEEAEEILVFHEQKQKEKGVSRVGRPDTLGGRVGWGVRDTCKALKLSVRRVSESLRIARAIRVNPELKNENASIILGRSMRPREVDKLIVTINNIIIELKIKKNPISKKLEDAIKTYRREMNERRNHGRLEAIERRFDELP